jgi:RNA polymerase sigma-70 factor (ECF subfamily)
MPAAFAPGCPEEVIRRYQDMVYRIAFTTCKNSADAEDITQEVFFRYLKKLPRFTGEEHLKAWLIRVAVNASKSLLRSAWFKKTAPFPEEIPSSEGQPQADTAAAVMALPEKYRSVVMLYYFEDYPVKEIANILSRSETAVQTQLQRARAMLKEKLKEEWADE